MERTVLCTFDEPLFDAQRKTLRHEIRKRGRKLKELGEALDRYRERPRGKAPSAPGVEKQVKLILNARHIEDLFAAKLSAGRNGLPRLRFRFQNEAWRILRATLLGKTILFTDRDAWSDDEIVLAYRSQYHVKGAFRCMKGPHFLRFGPTFHRTYQKLRVHALYCVLALMIASLLRRKLAHDGISLSVAKIMRLLAAIRELPSSIRDHTDAKAPRRYRSIQAGRHPTRHARLARSRTVPNQLRKPPRIGHTTREWQRAYQEVPFSTFSVGTR
ncbi:MAG: hypothetical protein HYX75_20720 [Acidobacteria bacterium]|nr:hypothetical protein [Acidobacteriota bacterium]